MYDDHTERLKRKVKKQNRIISRQKIRLSEKDQIIAQQAKTIYWLTQQFASLHHTDITHLKEGQIPHEAKDHQTIPGGENIIFRTHYRGREIDHKKLWDWINEYFLKRLTYKYDWFALWRILKDSGLIQNSKTSTSDFVRQMNIWYRDVHTECVCNEGNVNLYRSGYLGKTEYKYWRKADFLEQMKPKQREEGFDRLNDLCVYLSENLNITLFYNE